MFRPERDDGESNDDSDRDFEEPVQRDNLRRSRTRNQNDDGERNAGVAIINLLQTKRNREQSDENDCNRESSEVCAKKFASSTPTDAPTAVATIRSNESVSVAPRVDCITTNVANRSPVGLGHLHDSRDQDGRRRSDCRANRVRNRRKVLFVPSPELHANM